MAESNDFRVKEERSLRTDELHLLGWLISHGHSNAQRYSSQLNRASVVSRCTCGCPSIDLAVDGKAPPLGTSQVEVIADAEGKTPEGVEVGVILHCRAGQLSELEVYAVKPISGTFSLPPVATLVPLRDI
jgi:hypothetical protein